MRGTSAPLTYLIIGCKYRNNYLTDKILAFFSIFAIENLIDERDVSTRRIWRY